MNDEQIKEVMRLGDVIENLAWSAGKTEQYHDEPTDYAEKLPAARAELKAYLRTIGEPAGYSLPAGSIGAKKFAQVGGGFTPVGLVFSKGESAMAITEHGRVYWDRDLVHPISGEPEQSVNAELLEALKGMVGAHAIPSSYCKERPAYEQARAAIARAESAMPFWPNHPSAISDPLFHQARGIMGTENFGQEEALRLAILHVLNARAESAIESTPNPASPDLLESARAVVARWDAPTWKDLPATAEYIGRLRAAIAQADLGGALTAEEWVVKNVSGSPGLVRAMVIRAEVAESAIETPAKVSPCAGHAVQQEADEAGGA